MEAYLVTETDGDDFSVVVAETNADCALCNVVAEVQGSEVVPVLFPKAPVCEKTTTLQVNSSKLEIPSFDAELIWNILTFLPLNIL